MASAPKVIIDGPSNQMWYYVNEQNTREGPMSLDSLTRSWKEGMLNASTLVWHEGLTDWTSLRDLLKQVEEVSTKKL